MAIYDNRVCKSCSITFSGGPRSWYCPACRTERRRARDRIYQKRKSKRKIGSIDYCENCGAEYTVNGGLQKYCNDCKDIMHKKTDNEQSTKYYHTRVNREERNKKRRDRYSKLQNPPKPRKNSEWYLLDPDNNQYNFYNLSAWVKGNIKLFGSGFTEDNIQSIYYALNDCKRGRRKQYKGWRVINPYKTNNIV